MLARLAALHERRWLLLLAVIAVSVRIPWALAMLDRTLRFDEVAYVDHAESLCAGLGYVDPSGVASNFWPVGYPALLALGYTLFGVHAGVGVALQILLLCLTCLAASRIGEWRFGPRIGRTGALLLALYPNHVFYSTLMLGEPLATLLLVATTGLLLRAAGAGAGPGYAIGAGVLAGLTALVRPGFLLLPALLPLWCLLQKLGWRRSAVLTSLVALTSLATLAPWMIRSHDLTGAWFEVASNGGMVFWGGNHPDALGGVVRPRAVFSDLAVGTPGYDGSLGYRLGIESIRSDPPAALRRSMQKLTYFLALDTDGAMWNYKGLQDAGRGTVPIVLASLAYLAAMATGIFGLLHGLGDRAFGYWFLLLTAYSVALVIPFESDPRYHFPLIPFLLIYSAAGMLRDLPARWEEYRAGRLRVTKDPRLVSWSAAMAVLLLLIGVNLWLKTLEGRL